MGLSVILLHAMGGLLGSGSTYLCLGGMLVRVILEHGGQLVWSGWLVTAPSHVNCKQVLYNNYWLHLPSISRACSIHIKMLFTRMVLTFFIAFFAFLLAGVVVAVGVDEVIAVELLFCC